MMPTRSLLQARGGKTPRLKRPQLTMLCSSIGPTSTRLNEGLALMGELEKHIMMSIALSNLRMAWTDPACLRHFVLMTEYYRYTDPTPRHLVVVGARFLVVCTYWSICARSEEAHQSSVRKPARNFSEVIPSKHSCKLLSIQIMPAPVKILHHSVSCASRGKGVGRA